MSIQTALSQFGLSSREGKIYLTLRKYGLLNVAEIARETAIPRVSVYSCLENLQRNGVITRRKRNHRNVFEAHSPSLLLELLKDRFAQFEVALPLLNAVRAENLEDALFQLYDGHTQCRQAQEDFYEHLATKKVTLVKSIAHPGLAKTFPRFVPFMIQRRRDMGIATQLIVSEEHRRVIPSAYGATSGKGEREVRMLPKGYPLNCSCLIGGNSILFVITDRNKPSSVIIRSDAISTVLSTFFTFIWGQLQPYRP
jgi:sugar-specific transcriptional regulator TrmB